MQNELEKQINEFFEHLEVEKNASKLTIRNYRHYLEVFVKWYSSTLPDKSIGDLDLATVRRYRVFLAHQVDNKGKSLQKVTQNYYVISLRSFLRFLAKNDIKTLDSSKIELPKTESRSLKFLERAQIELLVTMPDTSKEAGVRDRTILELL